MREPIVVFDTNCVLCSGMVAFILAHERNRALRFVGAWSDEGLALAARHHFSKSDLDQTFLVSRAPSSNATRVLVVRNTHHDRLSWVKAQLRLQMDVSQSLPYY